MGHASAGHCGYWLLIWHIDDLTCGGPAERQYARRGPAARQECPPQAMIGDSAANDEDVGELANLIWAALA
jgi:hypothetical protein